MQRRKVIMPTIKISYWNPWFWGRKKQTIELPYTKAGYLKKKPQDAFLQAMRGLVGKAIRIEEVE